VHQEIPEDGSLARQWNKLVWQMESPEVFYTYQWALAVSRAYRDSITPLLILAYEHDLLVGVVALATDKAQRQTFFLAGTTADFCDFLSPSARRKEFVNLVVGELRKLKTAAFVATSVPADSGTVLALSDAAPPHRYRTLSRPASQCAQIALGSFAERLTRKNSVGSRKALRYYLKGLGKHGPVSVDHLESRECLATALPEFMRAHITRFSVAGRRSNLANPQRQAFLSELAGLLSPAGWIVLSVLRVGNDRVAWNYGFRFSGSWFYYQPTFDIGWEKFSPGFCLLSKIVEAACDDPGIERVDLGLGAEGYKARFATGTRQTVDVTVTGSTTHYLKEAARHHVVAAIKSSPRFEYGVRRILGRAPVGSA
jgi:CelD/BcsL family acetyltransferase involved in cellulose biosynthesis